MANYTPRGNVENVAAIRSTLRLYKGRPGKVRDFWWQSALPLEGMEEMLNLPKAR